MVYAADGVPTCHQRNEALAAGLRVLPGSIPYTNRRRLNVGGDFDGLTLAAFLARRHPHIDASIWQASLSGARLELDGRVVESLQRQVRAGNQLVHVIEGQVEPDVSAVLRFLHEDEDMVVLSKPAPLPVHPSGRFNKNTVVGLMASVFDDFRLLPVHRLDADTTGVLVLAKHPTAARKLGAQFEARTVGKRYLARVHGSPPRRFTGTASIARKPNSAGKRTTRRGAPALTHFWTLRPGSESLVAAWPRSGRTNQIRLHLRDAGHPIVGDQAYGHNAQDEFQSGGALCLHADAIRLRQPSSGRWVRFDAPRPEWASEFLG